jgi:hypothetical protein
MMIKMRMMSEEDLEEIKEDKEDKENKEVEEDEQGEEGETEEEMQRQQLRAYATAWEHSGQVYQAQRVSSSRATDGYLEFLQVFDVCTIAMETQQVPVIRGTFLCLSHK